MIRSFIFFCCSLSFGFVSEPFFSQSIKIEIESDREISVIEVFELIKKKTEYTFIYRTDLFVNAPRVRLKKGVIKANELLAKSLSFGDFYYELTSKNTIILKEKSIEIVQIKIRGKVTDENGNPLPRVNIQVKENPIKGTSTDFNGEYQLAVANNQTLIFNTIGFAKKEVSINGRFVVNVVLSEQPNVLDEVVVIGYGKVRKVDLTGSVSSINSEDLNFQPASQSFDQMLGGKLAGVSVAQVNGRPGAGAIVNIRGVSSIRGANQPLYIIDGIPILVQDVVADNFNNGTFLNENPLLSINPADIESIDVLKDASATAIYGSRAANGVILITTKRGRKLQKGKLSINYSSTVQSNTESLDLMNATEYKKYIIKVAENTIALSPDNNFANQVLNNDRGGFAAGMPYFGNADTDWSSVLLREVPISHTINVNYQGGTESTNYFAALNYGDQEGVTNGNDFKNIGVRLNLETEVSNKIKVGTNLSYNHSINKYAGSPLFTYSEIQYQPTLSPYTEDGSYTSFINFIGQPSYVPIANQEIENIDKAKNFNGSVYLEYKFTKGLRFKTTYNASVLTSDSRIFRPPFLPNLDNLTFNNSEAINTTWFNTLNYVKKFNNIHSTDILFGMSLENRELNQDGISARGIPNKILSSLSSATDIISGHESKQIGRLNSYFTRFNYNYDEKYYLTFTARADGSTKFGPNNRWGFFPSAAIMWNLSNESFLVDNTIISDLRLRGSLGRTGLANIPDFQYVIAYRPLNDLITQTYAGNSAVLSNGIPNPDVRWESTDQLDLALEFGLFKNMISGSINYYKKNTKGLLLLTPISPTTGSPSHITNVADMSNKGLEINLGLNANLGNVLWRSNFNIAFNQNRLDKLNGGSLASFGNPGSVQEGGELGSLYGYTIEGIFRNQAEIDALNASAPDGFYQDPSGMQVGAFRYLDLNGDGEITSADQKIHGSTQPDYFGGWNNTFKYKGFDFTFNLQFVEGVEKAWGDIKGSLINRHLLDQNKIVGILDNTYSADNPDALYESAIFTNQGVSEREFSIERQSVLDREVFDASFIRLKAVQLSYDLPKNLVDKLSVRSLKLNFTATNLWTFTEWPGLDPETITSSDNSLGFATFGQQITTLNSTYTYNSIPLTKAFTFGLNIGL
ncbi:TonB-dependent receptor [uncultured Polaribacter sp.]|uniref:SusC/RagA family TonB-linked outer membrane protein n=1 Tax=uncultured Polaribacter sp. TaxID=174711 RepID=UPI00260726E0|nr:TonB-dependent receptor [uncultured Polaribacter sp.]